MYRKLKLNEQYAYFFHVIRKILGVYVFQKDLIGKNLHISVKQKAVLSFDIL